MSGFKLRTRFDADPFLHKISALANTVGYNITIYMGESYGVDSKGAVSGSSHNSNKLKMRINREKYNRDPFFLTRKQRDAMHQKLRRAMVSEFNRNKKGVFRKKINEVSRQIVDIYKSNIDRGVLGPGAHPLSDRYSKWKGRRYVGQPNLKLTNAMYNSIKSKVKKVK